MPVPARKDVEHYRGDTLGMALFLWEDAAATAPVDLSEVIVVAQVRTTPDASSTLATFEVGVVGNQISLVLGPEITATLPAKSVYDCQVDWYSDGEQIQTVLAGALTVEPDVTRLG